MLKTIEKYKADQLPGGRLWKPSSHVRELCTNIPSTNDKCESLLGLNDWIHRRNPNFSQQTVSTLCQTARNKTSDWLNEQPRSLQHKIIQVAKREANTRHSEGRRKKPLHTKKRNAAWQEKLTKIRKRKQQIATGKNQAKRYKPSQAKNEAKLEIGTKIKHLIQEDDEEVKEYYGTIVEVSKNSVDILYTGDENAYQWTADEINEDLTNGDVTIMVVD